MQTLTFEGLRAAHLPRHGPLLSSEANAVELVGAIYDLDIDLIVIPVERLSPDFFGLANHKAGHFIQKLTKYGQRVALVGSLSDKLKWSPALRNFMCESNNTGSVLFPRDTAELAGLAR